MHHTKTYRREHLITIVLATYDGEKYILDQLESLLKQTRPADEVIICDDKSTDSTVEKVKSFICDHNLDHWYLYVNEENVGFRKNFMNGIRKAKGDIIFLCEQDGIWDLDKVGKMSEIMEEQRDIDLLACRCIEFRGETPEKTEEMPGTGEVNRVPLPDNILNVPFPGCTYCFRRSLFEACEPYWLEISPHDAVLWRSAVLLGTAYVLDQAFIFWRKHEDSAWSKESGPECVETELKWRSAEVKELTELKRFVENVVTADKTAKEKLLDENMGWSLLRTQFFKTKSLLSGIRLFGYRKCYPGGIKGWLRDWKLVCVS